MTLGRKLLARTIRSPSTPKFTKVPHRSLLSITGAHAVPFLNGILSNTLPVAGGIYSSFLHAQGRVLYDAFVYPYRLDGTGDTGYLVEYDPRPSEAPPLLTLLKRYVLRSKVKIRDVGAEWNVWAAWGSQDVDNRGPERCWHWAASQCIEPNWKSTKSPWQGDHGLQLHDRRIDGMGLREIVRRGDRPSFCSTYDEVDEHQYLLHRIRHGVPEGTEEIMPLHAFPMESNLDLMGAIDFRKGCFVGQELTVRTYHTGLVRKRIMSVQVSVATAQPCTFDPSPTAPLLTVPQDIIPIPLGNHNGDERTTRIRGAGKLLTSYQGLGLALIRVEHMEAVDNNQIMLGIKPQDNNENATGINVRHWWPDAWPTRPSGE